MARPPVCQNRPPTPTGRLKGVTSLVPDDLARPPTGPLWRTPGLAVLFTASTTARLANESARVAVVLLVLARTGSPALAGAVVAGLTLPALITGPLLGAWLDRTHHRRSAFVANQILLPVTLVLLLALTGHVPGVVVVLLTALAGITSPVLTGGFTGLIGPLVPDAMLRRAYGAESTSYNVAGVVGPSLAAGITAAASASAAVVVSAALSAVALLAVLRVPMPPPLSISAEGLLQAVRSGLRHLATTPALRSVTVATTLSFMGIGAFPVVFPALAVDVGAKTEASGLLFSGFALGALLGSLVVAARAPRMGPLRLALLGIAGLTVLFIGIAEAPGLGVALVLVVIAGAFEGPVLASTLTVRELYSPATMRTQVVTTAASLKFGAAAAGSALGGHVVAVSDGRTGALLVAGCQGAGVLAGAVALGWPALRHRFAR